MSCDVSVPSIEAHIPAPDLQSNNQARENEGHSECPHHFSGYPFVLPDSVPDDLVEFPGELKLTAPRQSHPCLLVRKPPTTAQPTKAPPFERSQRVRELLDGSSLPLAHLKSHGHARHPPNTTARKPLGSLPQATRQEHFPRKS